MDKCDANMSRTAFCLSAIFISLGVGMRLFYWGIDIQDSDYYFLKAGLVTTSLKDLLIMGLPFDQSAPIGYVVMTKFLGFLSNYNDWVMRLPSCLAGILSLFLFMRLLRRVGLSDMVVLGVLLFSLNPSLIYFSAVLKQYSGDVLAVVIVLLLFSDGVGKNATSRFAQSLVLSALFPFSHALFFVGGAAGCCLGLHMLLAFLKDRKIESKDVLGLVVLGCTAAFCAWWTVKTMPQYMFQGFWDAAFAPLPMSVSALKWYAVKIPGLFRGPVFFLWVPAMAGWTCALLFVPLALVVWGVWTARKNVLFMVLAGTFLLCLGAALARHWAFSSGGGITACRTILFLAPVLIVFLCIGTQGVSCRSKWINSCMVCLVLCSLIMINVVERPRTWKTEDAIDTLSAEMKTGDALVCDYHVWTALLSDTSRNVLSRFGDRVFIQKKLGSDIGEVVLPAEAVGHVHRVFVAYIDTRDRVENKWYGAHRPAFRRFVDSLRVDYAKECAPAMLIRGCLKE